MKRLIATALIMFCVIVSQATAARAMPIDAKIESYIASTWHMQRVMHQATTPTNRSYRRTKSAKYKRWVLHYWKRVNWRVNQQYRNVPMASSWLCIHRYEGAWNDPAPPFYGGLQMDLVFQSKYGSYLLRTKGTADRWTPNEQMWTATAAYRSGRGFKPWPNTARSCGLL